MSERLSESTSRLSRALSKLGVGAAVGLVRAYQLLISPWLGRPCRHSPSCSAYAVEALRRFGVLRGGWLTAKSSRPLPSVGHERLRSRTCRA